MKHKLKWYGIALSLGWVLAGCSSSKKETDQAYDLGSVAGFCELVGADVKKLALSPVINPEDADAFYERVVPLADQYGVSVYRETDLIVTDLFPDDVASGKVVFLIYKGDVLSAYLQLKEEINGLQADEEYKGLKRRELSRRFGRMLSYSPQKINALLAGQTAFRTLTDFGIRASNVFLYYKDLPAATAFYQDIIGLELLAEYDNASIFRMAGSSYIILVDAAKGMHTAEEPKTVALAFLTNQLKGWWDYLQANNVPVKYPYKAREGSAHDGFVVIDPEGYLLEFETFKQHPENEDFMPVLNRLEPVKTFSDGLSFNAGITWLYYKDILAMQGFYEQVLGLKLVADQGWAKIYQGSPTGFIGLVDERRGMHAYTDDKAVTLSFIMDDLDGWFDYVNQNGSFELRSEKIGLGPDSLYRAFVGYDPEGYYLEFDRFYRHPVNERLMQLLNE